MKGLVNLAHCVRWPYDFFVGGLTRHGPNFTADLAGLGRFVFIGDAATLRDVFQGDPEILRTGEANRFAASMLGQSSVLTLDGEPHAQARRALIPPLHGEHLHAHAATVRELTEAEVDRWRPGEPVAIEDVCREITLQAILRVAFGLSEAAAREPVADLMRQLMAQLAHPLAFFAPLIPRWLQGSASREVFRLQALLDEATFALVAARRAEGPRAGGKDVLSVLLELRHPGGEPLSDREIRDHLFTMLVAGHDTTAIAMAWAVGDLVTRPTLLERVTAELAGAAIEPEALERLEHFDAAIRESLRIHPLVDFGVRLLARPFEAGGVTYPAGVTLAPCTLLAHYNPKNFDAPHEFRPERFVGARPDPDVWIPFGGGRRRCLGMNFALFEMRIMLAVMLRRVRFAARAEWPPRMARRGLFLAPADRATFTPSSVAGRRLAPLR